MSQIQLVHNFLIIIFTTPEFHCAISIYAYSSAMLIFMHYSHKTIRNCSQMHDWVQDFDYFSSLSKRNLSCKKSIMAASWQLQWKLIDRTFPMPKFKSRWQELKNHWVHSQNLFNAWVSCISIIPNLLPYGYMMPALFRLDQSQF